MEIAGQIISGVAEFVQFLWGLGTPGKIAVGVLILLILSPFAEVFEVLFLLMFLGTSSRKKK